MNNDDEPMRFAWWSNVWRLNGSLRSRWRSEKGDPESSAVAVGYAFEDQKLTLVVDMTLERERAAGELKRARSPSMDSAPSLFQVRCYLSNPWLPARQLSTSTLLLFFQRNNDTTSWMRQFFPLPPKIYCALLLLMRYLSFSASLTIVNLYKYSNII